ncbi:hypothetical protein [Spirosoma agri]|nr:hypothetical protein [Spirosoma agri]
MKTLFNSLLVTFTLSLVTVSASLAKTNPGKQADTATTYKPASTPTGRVI